MSKEVVSGYVPQKWRTYAEEKRSEYGTFGNVIVAGFKALEESDVSPSGARENADSDSGNGSGNRGRDFNPDGADSVGRSVEGDASGTVDAEQGGGNDGGKRDPWYEREFF
jgi:hypothetical protein